MNKTLTEAKRCKIDKAIAKIRYHHPCAAFIVLLLGLPLFILTSVFACATAVMLPISWLLGWI